MTRNDKDKSGRNVVEDALRSGDVVKTGAEPPGYGQCEVCRGPLNMAGHCADLSCQARQDTRLPVPLPKTLPAALKEAEALQSRAEKPVCEVCRGKGYLFPHGPYGDWVCVEACDLCGKHAYDDDAAAALGEELLRINTAYVIVRAVDPSVDLGLDDMPGCRFVVASHHMNSGSFRPIDEAEATELAYELGIFEKPKPTSKPVKPKACPHCGATDLVVSLQAAFGWSGADGTLSREDLKSCEFPVGDDAMCVCNTCENIFRVRDMKDVK